MAGSAHPDAMAPPKPGRTRTAPPEMPSTWWSAPRIRNYLLFDATGIIYLLVGFGVIHQVWALGDGPDRWVQVLFYFRPNFPAVIRRDNIDQIFHYVGRTLRASNGGG